MPVRKKLTPRIRDPVTGRFKSTRTQRSRDPATGRFQRVWNCQNRTQSNMPDPTPRQETVDLTYMRNNNILKNYVFCHECEKRGRYNITGQNDVTVKVRFELKEEVDPDIVFEPWYNESQVEDIWHQTFNAGLLLHSEKM